MKRMARHRAVEPHEVEASIAVFRRARMVAIRPPKHRLVTVVAVAERRQQAFAQVPGKTVDFRGEVAYVTCNVKRHVSAGPERSADMFCNGRNSPAGRPRELFKPLKCGKSCGVSIF